MANYNPIEKTSSGKKFRPLCSGWKVFPNGKKCKGCEDCLTEKTNKMAVKKKTSRKRATPKQAAAQKKFAANSKKVAQLVKSGKAKSRKAAWKMIKK